MYIDSILCNLAVLVIKGNLFEAFESSGTYIFKDPKVLLIMFNNAAIGIITSFFLKNLNSIVKTFASALELVFTAALCWVFFGIPIYINTALAIAIVSLAVVLYARNPVQNKPISYNNSSSEESESLIVEHKSQIV